MEPAKSNMATNDRTEAAAALSPLLTSAATEALRRYADLRSKWRNVYTGLVRLSQTSGGLVRYQPDHLIDLIVRSMEDELAARHRATPEGNGRVHLEDTLQHVLTRYWVLGTHDVLRIAARSHAGKVHPKLTSLYDRFRLVRVPLAKLKITGDDALKDGRVMLVHAEGEEAKPEAYRSRSNDEYHPPTPIDERGSIGWHLFDAKTMLPVTIYRRQLSDELLALFD
jgi:hypothetical protein